ncbi:MULTISPECIES: hypothetical protein [Nocardia]|uniref:hypothetical protein n=1 Tax=Nocardia TaxID=1817 RepID=UPI00130099F4|nr:MULTISPECIES: hypothetical protein [Nocardia]
MVVRAGALRVHPLGPAKPDRVARCPGTARVARRGGPWISVLAAALLIGVGLSAPTKAQPAPPGPGPGLFTIRPLAHLDQVLTADPISKAAVCEGDDDDPEQTIRVRPVRNMYNLLNQRTDEYLGYHRDGRTGWTELLAEWEVVAVDGFGEGVYRIRVLDLDGPPADVLTYLGGDNSAVAGVRAAADPGHPAFEAQLWKFERATGNRPFSGKLETNDGS